MFDSFFYCISFWELETACVGYVKGNALFGKNIGNLI